MIWIAGTILADDKRMTTSEEHVLSIDHSLCVPLVSKLSCPFFFKRTARKQIRQIRTIDKRSTFDTYVPRSSLAKRFKSRSAQVIRELTISSRNEIRAFRLTRNSFDKTSNVLLFFFDFVIVRRLILMNGE